MKKVISLCLLFMAACSVTLQAHATNYRIDHLEPSVWWTGMQNRTLQLLVHGPAIADLEPTLVMPGVQLTSVQRVANRNYLFLNLTIAAIAAPGTFDIVFRRGSAGEPVLTHAYTLLAREKQSAQRRGFSSADVVLNLMPDRFANGNPANDSVPQLQEKVNRAYPGGRHGGDIEGMRQHLDYLAALGYTAMWPTPLLESDQREYSYHGYAMTNHYLVDARYGSNADYQRLVAEAKAKGIVMIQDIVLNHIGSGHWWMRDLPTPDWITHGSKFVGTRHHRLAVQDPYASNADRDNFVTGWFEPNMPDLNQRNPLLANYLIQNTIWWIEYAGLNGIRVDTYGYSDSAFLTDWSRAVMAEYPNLHMVGEEWNGNPNVVSRWQRGKNNFDGYVSHMPGMIDFPVHEAMRRAFAGDSGNLDALYEMLALDYLYPAPRKLMLFEGNHDVPRTFSVLDDDPALYRMAMVFLLTAPRIPQLYYGTEVQMPSPKERDDAAARRDFPGGWAGDKVNAFTGEGLSLQQKEAQAFVRQMLNWRKTQTVVHDGKFLHFAPEDGTYVYFRYDGSKKLMVVFNKNKKDTELATARFAEMLKGASSGIDALSGKTVSVKDVIRLPARSALILELAP